MKSHNAIYELATRPFLDGHADLSALTGFVDECVKHPPLDPLPSEDIYFEVLPENVDWSQQPSISFHNYVTLLTLLVAELWAEQHLIALFAARNLWEIACADAVSAAQTRLLLSGLARHPAYLRNPHTHALISGLRGLFDLCDSNHKLSVGTVELLDEGIAFPLSGFAKHQLQGLLWNSSIDKVAMTPLTWDDLLLHTKSKPREVQQALLDVYPRAFFALRYWRMAEDHLTGEPLKANETWCEGAKEIFSTPGEEYLATNDLERLRADYTNDYNKLLDLLQSCIYLTNRAEALLNQSDAWPLTYFIHVTAAEARYRAFQWTQDEGMLRAARRFLLRSAWAVRRPSPLLLNGARNLLAKVYDAWKMPHRARRYWKAMLHSVDKHPDDFAASSIVTTANAALGQAAIDSGDFASAKEYCLAAIAHLKGDLESNISADHFDLENWTGSILDNAISACAATNDSAGALDVLERWYRSAALTRHLGLEPVNEADLRDKLDDGTAIVYLSASGPGISIIVVSRTEAKAQLIEGYNWQDLQNALGPWFKAVWRLRNSAPAQALEALEMLKAAMDRTLSDLAAIVQPVADRLWEYRVCRAVLIPGRGLGMLPLHAVPLDAANPDSPRLGDVVDILYAPNATVWLHAVMTQSERCHERRFEAFSSSDAGFSAELRQAGSLWGAANPPRFNASVSEFLNIAADSAILHISCHGWFLVVQSQTGGLDVDAGLKLGLERLDWRDLFKELRLPCSRLVVLSACESLLVSHRDILNQQFGLPYAFIAAGAPLLLGTSWKVETTATALLVTRFHENLVRNAVVSSRALSEAQTWLRTLCRTQVREALIHYFGEQAQAAWVPEGKCPYAHPYWWASFILIGADLADRSKQ